MQDADISTDAVVFRPDVNVIKASLVGPTMLVGIAAVLAGGGIIMFLTDDGPDGFLLARLAILAVTLLICAAIAYFPLRRLAKQRVLLDMVKLEGYSVSVTPQDVVVQIGNDSFHFALKDYDIVGKDAKILGNKRDWGALVLMRDAVEKLDYAQRASIVVPAQKGHIHPSTENGITTIPLTYFNKDQFDLITDRAFDAHARLRGAHKDQVAV